MNTQHRQRESNFADRALAIAAMRRGKGVNARKRHGCNKWHGYTTRRQVRTWRWLRGPVLPATAVRKHRSAADGARAQRVRTLQPLQQTAPVEDVATRQLLCRRHALLTDGAVVVVREQLSAGGTGYPVCSPSHPSTPNYSNCTTIQRPNTNHQP